MVFSSLRYSATLLFPLDSRLCFLSFLARLTHEVAQPAPANPAMTLLLHAERQCGGVAEARRLAFGMKAMLLSIFVSLSVVAFAGDSKTIEIPGYVIHPPSAPNGEEWWMSDTKPLELSRYSLTKETLKRPLAVTILRYSSPEKARKAFQMSWAGRPQAPNELKVIHWDAAHRWTTDICLLKGDYVVGLYDLPSDFSGAALNELLEALSDNIAKADGGAANRSGPVSSGTNSTSSAGGSDR
jgi:hypothetical protein